VPAHATPWRTLVALWRLGRYRFLFGGFVLYALGAALARAQRPIDVVDYVLGQAVITAMQLMTHYANDYFDLESDVANQTPTTWSGGSRVLAEGSLRREVARDAALALGAVSLVVTAAIARRGHATPGTVTLFLTTLIVSWEYSAPPLRLHSHGLGPLAAAIVVGGFTPLAGFAAQGAPWSRSAFVSVLPLMVAQFALILVLDFPDADGDARTGKRTLVVSLGRGRAIVMACIAIALTYAVLPVVVGLGADPRLSVGIALTLPLGGWLAWTLVFGDWRDGATAGPLAFRGVLWFALVSLGALLGVLTAGRVLG
jgi:1,4-dihydroxy-2-naphthoate polyprenyltransferase